MGIPIKTFQPVLYLIIACASAVLALWFESAEIIPQGIIVLLPAAGICVILSIRTLLPFSTCTRQFIFSTRGAVVLLSLILLLALVCTPVDELFNREMWKPFKPYTWLVVSLFGFLSVVSFLNYALLRPDSSWLNMVVFVKKIWQLPAKLFIVLFSVWIFCITNVFSFTAFEHIPHVQDAIAQLFQAKIFKTGHLTAPLPPLVDFFHYFLDNMIFSDRWYSQYPPGHAVLLLLGLLLGAPWIINPLLASLSVPLIYGIGRQFYGEQEARLSVILFSVSPFVLFMSASFMNHVSTLFFLLVFLYSFNKSLVAGNIFFTLLSGFALGCIFHIRPSDAAPLALLFGGIMVFSTLRKRHFKHFICFVSTCSVMLILLLLYNYATNGDPLLFGYQVRWGQQHMFGFTDQVVINTPPHTPFRGAGHTMSNLIALNQYLFEWPFPCLVPLCIFFMPFVFKKSKTDYLLAAGGLLAPVFYFFYFFQDLCLGPRFFYISIPFIILVTARSIARIAKGIGAIRTVPLAQVTNAIIAVLCFSVAFTCLVRLPKLHSYYADSFWQVDNRLMKKIQQMDITNAVVFQKPYGYRGSSLGSGFLHNSPDLKNTVVFTRDLGERNNELVAFFPGRKFYLASRNKNGDIVIEPLKTP